MRVQRWVLDERRQQLGETETFADKLRGELAALDRHLAGEGLPSTPAQGPVAVRRTKLCATIAGLEREIEQAREELREAYEALESVQQAQESPAVAKRSRPPRRADVSAQKQDVGLYRRRRVVGD